MPRSRSNYLTRIAGWNIIDTLVLVTVSMRKRIFRSIARINKALLPRLWDKDLVRLTKFQKLIVAWKYYITRNSL